MADIQARQSLSNFQGDHLSVHMDAGAGSRCVGDVQIVFDGAMTAASATFTSSTAGFTADDVGKLMKVYNAGVGQFSPHLYTAIASFVGPSQVTLSAVASRTVSGQQAFFGTDFTLQFQALLDAGNSLYVPFGAYGIVGPLTVKPGVRIYGQCKGAGLFSPGGSGAGTSGAALGSCLVNFSDSEFAIEYLSNGTPSQIQDGFWFEHMTILSKNGIRLNNPTVASASQSFIHPATCQDILFQGDYDYDNDPESWTDVLPTATGSANSLDQYGVGFAGRNLLRCELNDCTFYNYGIANWMVDWSQCSIRHSRLVHGGLFVWVGNEGFLSNRNKIINNEIIEFSRKGAIYIEYANQLLIQGNWFEENSAADLSWLLHDNPTYIWSEFDDGLIVCENAILDNYSLTAPIYRISPRIPALIYGNIYGSSGLTKATAELDRSHYEATNVDWSTAPAKIFGNDFAFPIPTTPNVVRAPENTFYKISYEQPANIIGAATAVDPWAVSAVTGDWIVRTDILGFIWIPPVQSPAHRDFRCAVTARWLGVDPFFVAVYLFYKVADIIDMTSTNPIVVETGVAHGLATGDFVYIKDFLYADFSGFPGVGISQITVTNATHFSLNGLDGTGGGSYRQGGEVYKRLLIEVFNPGITKTTRMETGYIQFGLPDAIITKCFLGLDATNDRAELYSLELYPFEDSSRVIRGRDGQTAALANWQTYAGVEKASIDIDGRLHVPNRFASAQFKSASYTVLTTDEYIEAATGGGAVTLTLPTLASTYDATRTLGQRYIFKWLSGASTLTLDGNGSETIEDAATYVFRSLGDAIMIQNDGSQWRIVARYTVIEDVWRWVTPNASIRTDYDVGIGADPAASMKLTVNGIIQGAYRDTSVTANRPARWDGSKQLVNGQIDLGNAVDVIGSSMGVAVVKWDGSKLTTIIGQTTAIAVVISIGGATDTFFKSPSGTGSAFISLTTTTLTLNFTDGLYTS